MKNIKHYVIIGIEVVLLGIVGVSASTSVPSYGVSYTNSSSQENVSTVESALNELYKGFKVGDATAANILSGKKALVQGKEVTGSMPNNAGTTQAGSSFSASDSGTIGESGYTSTGSVKIPVAGYYDTNSTLTFDLTDNNNSYYSEGHNNSKAIITSQTVSGSTTVNSNSNGSLTLTFSNLSSITGISKISISGTGNRIITNSITISGNKVSFSFYCYSSGNYTPNISVTAFYVQT